MCSRCVLTVAWLMWGDPAICALVLPDASARSTSSSRCDSAPASGSRTRSTRRFATGAARTVSPWAARLIASTSSDRSTKSMMHEVPAEGDLEETARQCEDNGERAVGQQLEKCTSGECGVAVEPQVARSQGIHRRRPSVRQRSTPQHLVDLSFFPARSATQRSVQSDDESVDGDSEAPTNEGPRRPPRPPVAGDAGCDVGEQIDQEDDDHSSSEHTGVDVEG